MVGEKLAGRYRLESEIARGGMGTVWRAVDEVLERPVAAKILHEHLAEDATFRERFRIEALAAAALTHPNIVAVYDTGEHLGLPFIVMEYMGGGTLKDRLDRQTTLSASQTAKIGCEICSALEFAHRAGVVHRDIKPANILFSASGHVKVGDFGIAKAAFGATDLTATGAILGTVRYISPEQVESREPDSRSDLYSLGVVLYETLTGRSPHTGETDLAMAMARVNSIPMRPRDVKPDVPRDLDNAIMRALGGVEERFQDAASLRGALERAAGRDSDRHELTEHIPQFTEASFVRSEGKWLLQILLILAIAAGIVFGVAQLSREGRPLEALGDLITGNGQADNPAEIVSGGSYDPGSRDAGENEGEVEAAFDGKAETYWNTEWYTNENFGTLKQGVGIYIDLGAQKSLDALEVRTVTPGWEATLRYSDDKTNWSSPGSLSTVSDETFRFDVKGRHRYWMIWITRLVRTAGEGDLTLPYSVAIEEIRAIETR